MVCAAGDRGRARRGARLRRRPGRRRLRGGPGLEPARRGRRRGRPGAEALGRARHGRDAGRAARLRRRRAERRRAAPRARRGPRGLRVRLRDPRHGRRRRLDERRRLRRRLARDHGARVRGHRGRRRLADAGRARHVLSPLRPRPRPGRGARRVPPPSAGPGRDQGRGPGAERHPQGRPADEPAHVRERVQEPRARADRRPHARGLRPQGLPRRRRADLPEARELHRERGGRALGGGDRADDRGATPGAGAVRCRAPSRGRIARLRSNPPFEGERFLRKRHRER